MGITVAEWSRLLEAEYLQEFTNEGGAAVKIAVAPEGTASSVLDAVAEAARRHGYLVASVDAAETRVHMIDQLFASVARQIGWDALTERWLRSRFEENGYYIPESESLRDVESIADRCDMLKQDLFKEVRRWTINGILKDYTLGKEFRTAITMLCWSFINPQNVAASDAEVLKQWFRGEKCNLTTLKNMRIYQKIGRHNARLMLSSLARWLPKVGIPGLVLLLDLSAVVVDTPLHEEAIEYTRNAMLDCYEVLRQFIDDTDELSHLLIVGVSGPGLLDNQKRNLDNYTALKLRISDEVRDRNRANPLGSLVRLDIEDEASVICPL